MSAPKNIINYRFGDITLDTARRRVRRGVTDIRLGKLTYELLLLLVEAAPRVVTQDEVAKRLWGDRLTTPDTIRQRVKLLRKALSDDPDQPRYFSVVRGQGYRLIPDVESLPIGPPTSNRARGRLLVAGIVLLVAAPLSLIYWGVFSTENGAERSSVPAQSNPPETSIAVLPFENLSSNPDDAYFVDGIHNDLLTQLFKISSLKVISRTSVAEYEDGKKNLRQIGRELDVATILEGSVQRSGDMVRINVQLIDAESDEHLWAERYDRELTAQNLFDIQSDMAISIASALQAMLSPEELARINDMPTVNMRAYNFYLIGNHYLRGTDNLTVFADAAQAFQSAVDQDPEFALAWAFLSRAHSGVYFFVDHAEARRELAREAVERAFELQPDLPEAHFAMGYYYYHGFRDDENALQEWALAEQGMPGDSRVHLARAYLYRRMGNIEQSTASFEQAIELDPRNVEQLYVQAFTHLQLRDYTSTERVIDRLLELAPDRPLGYNLQGDLALWRDGDFTSARTALENAPIEFAAPQLSWVAALYERDYDAALGYLDDWGSDVDDRQHSFAPIASYYGLTYQLAGMPELAAENFRIARTKVDRALEGKPEDPRIIIALADILAHQGEGELAANYARRAMELLPTSKDALAGPPLHLNAIMVLIAVGDYGAAVEELDAYLAGPGRWSVEGLLPDPRLDPLRSDPRFAAVVEKYRRQ